MNNFQYIVKDDTRAAMHMAVELCERGDFDSVTEAVRWLIRERDKSRWAELFGTPERAARTIAMMTDKCSDRVHGCDGCMLFDVCDDEANILEWLRGDAR